MTVDNPVVFPIRTLAVLGVLALSLTLFAAPSAAVGLPPTPVGPPIVANDSTLYWQIAPTVAPTADGQFLAVWEDMRAGLVARFLGADGGPLGAEIPLVSNTPFPENPAPVDYVAHLKPSLTALPDGRFLLVWVREDSTLRYSYFHVDNDVHDVAVVAQVVGPSGVLVGEPFRLDAAGEGEPVEPVAALLSDGRVVVAWERKAGDVSDVVARVVDPAVGAVGAPVAVSDEPTIQPARPAVLGTSDGGFAVAWNSPDSAGSGVLVRSFGLDGAAAGPAARLNVLTNLHQSAPTLVPAPEGGFLAVWQHTVRHLREYRIHGRFVGADGAPEGGELQLTPEVLHSDSGATVLPLPEGGFYLVWLGWRGNTPSAFLGQALSAEGERVGEPVRLSDQRPPAQGKPGVAISGSSLMVAWETWDGGGKGVGARALVIPEVVEPVNLTVRGASGE